MISLPACTILLVKHMGKPECKWIQINTYISFMKTNPCVQWTPVFWHDLSPPAFRGEGGVPWRGGSLNHPWKVRSEKRDLVLWLCTPNHQNTTTPWNGKTVCWKDISLGCSERCWETWKINEPGCHILHWWSLACKNSLQTCLSHECHFLWQMFHTIANEKWCKSDLSIVADHQPYMVFFLLCIFVHIRLRKGTHGTWGSLAGVGSQNLSWVLRVLRDPWATPWFFTTPQRWSLIEINWT